MSILLTEILVRLGVAVLADGRCRPRWYRTDQERVCKAVQRVWWHGRRLPYASGKLTPAKYYWMRLQVTGSSWQILQYVRGAAC